MVAITNTTSLTFLKEAIDATLSEAETHLEAFSDDPTRLQELDQCGDAFQQLRGICQVLELPAAALMSEEMLLAAQELRERVADTRLQALGHAIVLLGRYFDYVQLKDAPLPALLIGGINDLRRAGGKPLIQESHFFSVDLSRERTVAPSGQPAPAETLADVSRRLRHMYQVGLLGVLREQNRATNLKLMGRALERLDRACGECGLSRLWWLARAVLDALQRDDMAITPARKALLSQYDRQIKKPVYQGAEARNDEAPLLLLKESLYLVSLCSAEDGVVGQVKACFGLHNEMTDAVLQRELALMTGSRGSVMRSVAAALREELGELKDTLDLASQGVADMNYQAVAEGMRRVAGTLGMVGKSEQVSALNARADEVATWGADQDAESQPFQALVDELLAVENVVASLERSLTPGDDVHRASNNEHISIYQLDDARMTVVGECRAGLTLAKRSLTAFMDNNWDGMHLANLPGTFASIAGGLMFLELDRARAVTQQCQQFIARTLISSDATPSGEAMETLADALTGIDYYLESMEEQKPIGEGVLEVAEQSVAALGYPVPVSA